MASGHANRANRPNTWLHRPATQREDFDLPTRSRSLIAPPSVNSLSSSGAAPGVMVLSAVGDSAATSGPKHRRCKVHNGLGRCPLRPNGYPRSRLSLRPLGNSPISAIQILLVMTLQTSSCLVGGRRPTERFARAPDAVRITVSLRANATRALPEPDRRAIASAHSLVSNLA